MGTYIHGIFRILCILVSTTELILNKWLLNWVTAQWQNSNVQLKKKKKSSLRTYMSYLCCWSKRIVWCNTQGVSQAEVIRIPFHGDICIFIWKEKAKISEVDIPCHCHISYSTGDFFCFLFKLQSLLEFWNPKEKQYKLMGYTLTRLSKCFTLTLNNTKQRRKYDTVYRRHLFLKEIKLFQIFKAFELITNWYIITGVEYLPSTVNQYMLYHR